MHGVTCPAFAITDFATNTSLPKDDNITQDENDALL